MQTVFTLIWVKTVCQSLFYGTLGLNGLSQRMTKLTKWHVRPAKTQISLGICPVWSASLLCTQWVPKDKLSSCGQRRLWSAWADAQADLTLRWAHMPLCRFCRELVKVCFSRKVISTKRKEFAPKREANSYLYSRQPFQKGGLNILTVVSLESVCIYPFIWVGLSLLSLNACGQQKTFARLEHAGPFKLKTDNKRGIK